LVIVLASMKKKKQIQSHQHVLWSPLGAHYVTPKMSNLSKMPYVKHAS